MTDRDRSDLRKALLWLDGLSAITKPEVNRNIGVITDTIAALRAEVEAIKHADEIGFDRFELGKQFADKALREEVERLRKELAEWEASRNHMIDIIHDSTAPLLARAEAAEAKVERVTRAIDDGEEDGLAAWVVLREIKQIVK